MEAYKFTGRVHSVSQTQTWPSRFAKRTLVLCQEREGGKYKSFLALDFTKSERRDNTKMLDNLRQGEAVEVSFYVESREGKNAGQWFTSCRAVKLERLASGGVDINLVGVSGKEPEDVEDNTDMPF